MFVPHQFTATSLSITLSCQEILASISIHVNPVSHVVKVTFSVVSHLDGLYSFGNVNIIHNDEEDSTVVLARRDETIWHNECALAGKNVFWNSSNNIWPAEVGSVKHDRFER